MSQIINNRYDFIYLFDCKDGNPNGDPDMANTPRFDPETFEGIVSDVCLKRKVRDYVFADKSQNGEPESGYDIFVLQGCSLESRQRMPYDSLKMEPINASQSESEDENQEEEAPERKSKAKFKKGDLETIQKARDWMCKKFFDVRTFGAVMSTKGFNCGQVRGPVQITFARSIDRVLTTTHGITRVNQTKEKDQIDKGGAGTMGDKHTIAYGLYRTHGFVNPHLAQTPSGTRFSEDDLEVLWKALLNMFDIDRSASRGLMACRGLYIFKHESKLGNAPAQQLFERITITKNDGVESPREFKDYKIVVNREGLPANVSLIEMR